jgi:hypothetical protein
VPVDRSTVLSVSQFCELLALDSTRFRGVECGRWVPDPAGGRRWETGIAIVQEPPMQMSGTMPQLTTGGKKIGGKKPSKKKC